MRVAINIAVLLIHNWICKRRVAPKNVASITIAEV